MGSSGYVPQKAHYLIAHTKKEGREMRVYSEFMHLKCARGKQHSPHLNLAQWIPHTEAHTSEASEDSDCCIADA